MAIPESTKLHVEFSNLQGLGNLLEIGDDLKRSERTKCFIN